MCYRFARQKSAKRAQWQLKKHIIQIPTGLNGNSATNTRRRFLKEEKQNEKKKRFHRPRIEPSSVTTKQIQFSFVQRLSTWANEAAARNHCVIVTSSFSQTKGFFCFSFNNRSPKDAAWKTESVLHTLFLDNEKRPSKTNFRAMFLR